MTKLPFTRTKVKRNSLTGCNHNINQLPYELVGMNGPTGPRPPIENGLW